MVSFAPLAAFLALLSAFGGTASALQPPIVDANAAATHAEKVPVSPGTRAARGHAQARPGGRSHRHTHAWHTEHHSKSEHHLHSEHHSSSHYRGRATWYAVGQGACGRMSSPDEPVVALNKPQYEEQGYSVSSGACFRSVLITNEKNGRTAKATVVDMCPGCEHGSMDMSPGMFEAMAEHGLGEGAFDISWKWYDGDDNGDRG